MEFARSSGAIESAERLCTIANGGPKERGEGVGGGRHVRELRKERGFVHVFELERWFFSMEKDIWHAMVCLRQ